MTEDGLLSVFIKDSDSKNPEGIVKQYAYIVNSSSGFMPNFGLILFDGEKVYYYNDSNTSREVRILYDSGEDINAISDDDLKEIAEKKADLYEDLSKEFEAKGINVTINRATGEISMDSSVLFGGDSAVVTNDGKELLNKFLSAYTAIVFNEKYDGFIKKTMVEGHIAPVSGSTYESGLGLSEERANNVKDYCISSESGVETSKLASTLEAVGLSNSKPIYDENGNIDMAACRRVSFKFIVNTSKQ